MRPSTADHRLAKDFKLDISLFERMILNGMHCATLGVQHRMRPEFAQLIAPSIYPNLRNQQSVYAFPSIMGMTKNLFFINHTYLEEVSNAFKFLWKVPFRGFLVFFFGLRQGWIFYQIFACLFPKKIRNLNEGRNSHAQLFELYSKILHDDFCYFWVGEVKLRR